MMVPTAVVESAPVLLKKKKGQWDILDVHIYRMDIRPSPDEPMGNVRGVRTLRFELIGERADPRDLVPGQSIHITCLREGDNGDLEGFGIVMERYGCCDNCEAEGQVYFTPESPTSSHCARCVGRGQPVAIGPRGPVMNIPD